MSLIWMISQSLPRSHRPISLSPLEWPSTHSSPPQTPYGKHNPPVKKQYHRHPERNHRRRSFGIERRWRRKGQLIPPIMGLIRGIVLLVVIRHVAMRIAARVRPVPFPSCVGPDDSPQSKEPAGNLIPDERCMKIQSC